MARDLKWRLSFMMFLEYCVPGATTPIISLYLKNYLHFELYQVGIILSMPAAAALVAPFVTSHIADRLISSERLLALCHLLAAGMMLALSQQTQFWSFLICFFVHGLLFMPTFGLTNAIAMHHVPDPKRDFGGIRAYGTAGWVVVAWVFGYLWLSGNESVRLPHALYVSALMSLALALYALFIPRSHVRAEKIEGLFSWDAIRVFARPGLALLCVLTFFNSMVHQFYYVGMSPFLSQIGFANRIIMPAMSMGQLSEVIILGLLGGFLGRWSMKRTMVIGALSQAVRYLLFGLGGAAITLLGISMHGFCYAFFFTTGYLYVDHHSTPGTRAGAQQLFTIIISGFGVFAGSLAAGWTGQFLTNAETGLINYPIFWLVPAALGLAVAVIMALYFREEPGDTSET